MNNDPITWKVTLEEFDDPNATWGRTIIINPLINTTSYFYANLPLYVRQSLRDNKGALDPEKLKAYFNNKAQQVINGIVYGYRVLNYIPFLNLMESIQLALRQGVYLAIDKLCANTFNEITESSSISTTNLTIDQDVTNWLTKSGFVGTSAYKKIQLSGIKNYELIWDYHGNLKEIIYNKKPLKINFKTGEILYDVEINTPSDDSLLTRKEITKLIPKIEEQPFKTGQYVSQSYFKSNSTVASQDNPIYTKEDVNKDIQDSLKSKQDSLNDNKEHLIDKMSKSILHTMEWDADLQKKFDEKLTTVNLPSELQNRITAGDNIEIDKTDNGIKIIGKGGSGGDPFWKSTEESRTITLQDAYSNIDMTGKSILNILGLSTFINSTNNFDIFNKDNNSLVLQLGTNEISFYNSNRSKSYLTINTSSDSTISNWTNESFENLLSIDHKNSNVEIPSYQKKLTAGTNISISNNLIESKPKNLYTDGLKSMSVIDIEQKFDSIIDLLTEVKSKCGDRGSGHFNLTISSKSSGNLRLRGYVEREYSQTDPYFKLFLMNTSNESILNFYEGDIKIEYLSGNFYFNDDFSIIGSDASIRLRKSGGAALNGFAVNGGYGYFSGFYFNPPENSAWSISESTTLETLNSFSYIINLGIQIGYTNEN